MTKKINLDIEIMKKRWKMLWKNKKIVFEIFHHIILSLSNRNWMESTRENGLKMMLKVLCNMGEKQWQKWSLIEYILNFSEFIKRRKILVYGSIWDGNGRMFNIQFYCVLVYVRVCAHPFRKSKTKRVEGYSVRDTKKGFSFSFA